MECNRKEWLGRNNRLSNHKFTYVHAIPYLRFHIYLTSSMSNDNTDMKMYSVGGIMIISCGYSF